MLDNNVTKSGFLGSDWKFAGYDALYSAVPSIWTQK